MFMPLSSGVHEILTYLHEWNVLKFKSPFGSLRYLEFSFSGLKFGHELLFLLGRVRNRILYLVVKLRCRA
jgi:hypothetical protein